MITCALLKASVFNFIVRNKKLNDLCAHGGTNAALKGPACNLKGRG